MKTLIGLLFTLLTATAVATAQPPPDPGAPDSPPPQLREPNEGREMRPSLDSWLKQMEMRHPEDYQRLMRLKETDPEAFARELRSRRDRLRDRNLEAGMKEMPRIREMLENMPPEERARMAERFSRVMRSHDARRPAPEDEAIASGERKTWELAKAYQEAPEADRPAIGRALRAQITEVFELREKQHQCQIEEAEAHLKTLKSALAKRREHRQRIVDHRFQELTTKDANGRRQRGSR